jgi:hypothetical protein
MLFVNNIFLPLRNEKWDPVSRNACKYFSFLLFPPPALHTQNEYKKTAL